jgi:hypothetical protein
VSGRAGTDDGNEKGPEQLDSKCREEHQSLIEKRKFTTKK